MLFTAYSDGEINLLLEVGQIKKFSQFDDNKFVQLSKKIPIFKGLSDSDIDSLMLNPKFLKFGNKDLIIKEGLLVNEIYFILSGEVNIVIEDKIITSQKQGNLIALTSFVNSSKMPVNVVSKGDSVIFSFRVNLQISNDTKIYSAYLLYKNISKYLSTKIVDISQKMAYI